MRREKGKEVIMANRDAVNIETGGPVANEKGMVLVIVMLLITVLSIIGIAANTSVITDTSITSNYLSSARAFYVADGGAEYGYNRLRYQLRYLNPNVGSITSPSVGGYTFDAFSIASEGASTSQILAGTYAGLTAYLQNYRINSKARETGGYSSARVETVALDQLIPVFQFGIFYQNDLELIPGADMTFLGGRIHSNKNIYFSSDGHNLNVRTSVTSAGNIYKGQSANDPSARSSGNVYINDASGTLQQMTSDSSDATWQSYHISTWGGNVKNSAADGIYELNLPMDSTNPVDILGMGAGSLYEKSGLRIMNGVAKDGSGNTLNLTCDGVNPITTKSFRDGREGKTVNVYEVDIGKLQCATNTAAMNALNNPPSGGDPGILYIHSDSTDGHWVRLVNGSQIPSSGLSVVSDNPIYIQGDYNVANRPAAVFADAVTVLSNQWNRKTPSPFNTDTDSTSNPSSLSNRVASDTTVNAAVMAGNKSTGPDSGGTNRYSGGAENFIRFLENWSGKSFNYSGSLICLWESMQATGYWGKSNVYNPPNRNYSYGVNSSNLAPGTPRVRNVTRGAWRQVAR
jgi:hypothetical protein